MPKILAILAEGFEEIEAIAPIDLLRRAGVEVTVASLGPELLIRGRTGIAVQADIPLAATSETFFDGLFLPGGPHVKLLRADARIVPLTRRFATDGKWVTAICAAPVILKDAGLLDNRRYTAHFSVANELPAILSNEKVVVDGRMITSRGAGTAIEFGLALVSHVVSESKKAEVLASICF